MADYVNLNYTAAEINADLAKVHGVDAVVPEAPKDGLEYVRKGGNWVQNVKGVDTTIGDMLMEIVSNNACTQEQYDYLIANLSDTSPLNYLTNYSQIYLISAYRDSNGGKIHVFFYGTYSIVGWISYEMTIESNLSVSALDSMLAFGTGSGLDVSFSYDGKDASISFVNNGTGTKYLSDNGQYQELYSKADIDSKIGDINTILDSINGEEV